MEETNMDNNNKDKIVTNVTTNTKNQDIATFSHKLRSTSRVLQ